MELRHLSLSSIPPIKLPRQLWRIYQESFTLFVNPDHPWAHFHSKTSCKNKLTPIRCPSSSLPLHLEMESELRKALFPSFNDAPRPPIHGWDKSFLIGQKCPIHAILVLNRARLIHMAIITQNSIHKCLGCENPNSPIISMHRTLSIVSISQVDVGYFSTTWEH